MMATEEVPQKGMTIKRTFNALPDRVWEAWTDPDMLKMWLSPRGFTTPVFRSELEVGGKLFYCMRSPDGKDFCGTGTYREISPRERLVYTDSFADEQGNVVPASQHGMSSAWPLETMVKVEFREQGDGTEVQLSNDGVPEGIDNTMARAGWNESLDKLDEYLRTGTVSAPRTVLIANPGVQEVTIRRAFDAPRDLVFRAFTEAGLISQWWGPARYRTEVEVLGARRGGSWRFIQHDEEGNEFSFRGVFHEVQAPELIIQTFEYEPMYGHVQLQTMRLEEREGRTFMDSKSVYLSVEDRDGQLSAGMESGMNEGYERLDALLEEMKRSRP